MKESIFIIHRTENYFTCCLKDTHSLNSRNTLFSSAHKTYSNIDYMLGHKTSLNILKKIKIKHNILSYYKEIK